MGSLTILTIFLVEVMFKVYAEGKHLLKHKAEVFDAIVVVVSFTMDITFIIVPVNEATKDYAGLIVLLRLWRVTRIINGVILSVKMDADKKLKVQKALKEKAEKQVQRLTDKLEKLTRENQKLRTRLALMEGRNTNNGSSGECSNGNNAVVSTTTPEDDDDVVNVDVDDCSPHSPHSHTPPHGRGVRASVSRHSSFSSTPQDDAAVFFAPRESSLPHLVAVSTPPVTPRRDDSSSSLPFYGSGSGGGGGHSHSAAATVAAVAVVSQSQSHGGSPVSAGPTNTSAGTPPLGDQRRSPALRYAYAAAPQGGRSRSEGSPSSLRTPPIESQQLLSFEEPLSEETGELRGIRETDIGLNTPPPVVGGKLVTGVS